MAKLFSEMQLPPFRPESVFDPFQLNVGVTNTHLSTRLLPPLSPPVCPPVCSFSSRLPTQRPLSTPDLFWLRCIQVYLAEITSRQSYFTSVEVQIQLRY
ncbi:hypothetical protein ECG_09310 [Echinococcus granulosus]|uniref:Uncharacterized protein n=1 Tax=Echinococcus granulosus TaxID=6210 RepID=A0A068WT73_ECHGR|nr:hypothetical protein ECG_09310 [Echinococcus granulosus]CDS23346.1 hypothetical protein EgrG_002039400 [Echinococcus granulosus]